MIMASFYREEWRWFKSRILKIFLIVACIFFLFTLLAFFYFQGHPQSARKQIADFLKATPIPDSMIGLFFMLFIRNSIVALVSILLGWIPFAFLPGLWVFRNGFLAAAFLFLGQVNGASILSIILLGIAPHGIFELPAFFYAASLGILLCWKRTKAFQTKRFLSMQPAQEAGEGAGDIFKRSMNSFLRVILPLLFLAALIEAFITPILLAAALPQIK